MPGYGCALYIWTDFSFLNGSKGPEFQQGVLKVFHKNQKGGGHIRIWLLAGTRISLC